MDCLAHRKHSEYLLIVLFRFLYIKPLSGFLISFTHGGTLPILGDIYILDYGTSEIREEHMDPDPGLTG